MEDKKKKKNSGRKTILNKEFINEICGHIENGATNKDACILTMITEETFYKWKNRGEENIKKGIDSIYSEFSESIKKSKIKFKLWHVQNIMKASQKEKHWTASAWLLERLFNDQFGKKLDIGGKVDVMKYDVELSEEEMEAYKERVKDLFGY